MWDIPGTAKQAKSAPEQDRQDSPSREGNLDGLFFLFKRRSLQLIPFATWQAGQIRSILLICACLLGLPNPGTRSAWLRIFLEKTAGSLSSCKCIKE